MMKSGWTLLFTLLSHAQIHHVIQYAYHLRCGVIVFRSLQTIKHLCDLHPFFPGADRFSTPNDAGWKGQVAQKFFPRCNWLLSNLFALAYHLVYRLMQCSPFPCQCAYSDTCDRNFTCEPGNIFLHYGNFQHVLSHEPL